MKTAILIPALLGLALGSVADIANATVNKALLIGIDGVQYEQLQQANTPNIDSLLISKAYCGGISNSSNQQQTSSGASWSTLLTGVWANKHGVISNGTAKANDAFPSLFKRINEARPNAYVASVINWAEPNSKYFADEMPLVDYHKEGISDENVTSEVVALLQNQDPDFIFSHIDAADGVGHAEGFTANYRRTLEIVDGQIGQMLAAVKQREAHYDEKWLVLVVTDHGRGTGGYGHGGQSVQEKTAFIASNYAAMNDEFFVNLSAPGSSDLELLYGYTNQTAVAPTILRHLGIELTRQDLSDGNALIGELGVRKLIAKIDQEPNQVSLGWKNGGQNLSPIHIFRNDTLIATLNNNEELYVDTLGSLEVGQHQLDYSVVANGNSQSARTEITVLEEVDFNDLPVEQLSHFYSFDDGLTDQVSPAMLSSEYQGVSASVDNFGNKALSINRDNGYFLMEDDFSQGSFSLGFWYKSDGSQDDPAIISNKDWQSGKNQGWILANKGSSIKLNIGDGTDRIDLDASYTPNSWVYVVMAVDRQLQQATLYVFDPVLGKQVKSAAINQIDEVSSPFSVVALNEDATTRYQQNNWHMTMQFNDLAIWHDTLSPSELQAIYQSTQSLSALLGKTTFERLPVAKLKHLYSMDGGQYTDTTRAQDLQASSVSESNTTPGPLGDAITVNRDAGYLYLTDDVSQGNFSVGFWYKSDGSKDDPAIVANKDWQSGRNQGWIIANIGEQIKLNLGDGSNRIDSNNIPYSANTWIYVAMAVNRSEKKVTLWIIDPILGKRSEVLELGALGNITSPFETIAFNEDGSGQYQTPGSRVSMEMSFDDVAIWTAALRDSQIDAIYNEGKSIASLLLSPSNLADMDHDGDVDRTDVRIFAQLLRSGTLLSEDYDFNQDEQINLSDVGAMVQFCTLARCQIIN